MPENKLPPNDTRRAGKDQDRAMPQVGGVAGRAAGVQPRNKETPDDAPLDTASPGAAADAEMAKDKQ